MLCPFEGLLQGREDAFQYEGIQSFFAGGGREVSEVLARQN